MVRKIDRTAPGWLGWSLVVALSMGLVAQVMAAGPLYWDWPQVQSFAELQLSGTTIDGQGNLVSGLSATSFSGEGPEVYWCVIADQKGGYFTGTGHGGKILHTDKKGKVRLHAELEGTEIFSLLLRPDGSLLAGCGPEGQLYRVDKKGESQLLGTVSGGYIWAMTTTEKSDQVLLAAGSPAALYRLNQDDELSLLREFPAQNALDVVQAADGRVLVATQGPGLVYQLTADLERSALLLALDQDEARQFIKGPAGELYVMGFNAEDQEMSAPEGLEPGPKSNSVAMLSVLFGEAEPVIPRSALYHLANGGGVHPIWFSDQELMIAAWDSDLGWIAGGVLDEDSGQSILYGLDLPAGEHPLARWAGGDILAILVTGQKNSNSELVVCQAFPGSVTVLGSRGDNPHQGICDPLDGGRPIRWGRLNWTATKGQGKLKWAVRGGNCDVPDDSWSQWSDSWTNQNHELDLPPSRFLQWRVTFPDGSDPQRSWRLAAVSVSAWRQNLTPVIAKFELEQLVGFQAGAMMNGSDQVTQTYRSGLFAEFSRAEKHEVEVDPTLVRISRPVRLFSWVGRDQEDDRLTYTLQYRMVGDQAWRNILVDTPETLGGWDTSEVVDGSYEIQLTASDKQDNPHHLALQTSRQLGPLNVDNTPPQLDSLRLDRDPRGFRLRFTVSDVASAVAVATIRLPDGSVERLDPTDGICDSLREEFDTVVTWPRTDLPAAGKADEGLPWAVGIAIQDLRGNLVSAEGEVR